ncbi:MAG: hypothetical protein ACJ8CR_26240 [Roseiflexaceae bacterium]
MSAQPVPFRYQNITQLLSKPFNLLAKTGWSGVIIGGLLLLAVAVAVVAQLAPNTASASATADSASAAAVLAAITASAVGIERVLEIFWTAIGLTVGSFWPLTRVHQQMDDFVKNLNAKLEPVYQHAKAEINKLSAKEQWAQERIDAATGQISSVRESLSQFQNMEPTNQRSRVMISVADQAITNLEGKYPAVTEAAQAAKHATDIAKNVLETFKDNPARRLISIYLGAILGLIVVGFTGLDVFHATLGINFASAYPSLPGIGVALTGLLMGLGANPTHEVIRVLQEIKEGHKAANNKAA